MKKLRGSLYTSGAVAIPSSGVPVQAQLSLPDFGDKVAFGVDQVIVNMDGLPAFSSSAVVTGLYYGVFKEQIDTSNPTLVECSGPIVIAGFSTIVAVSGAVQLAPVDVQNSIEKLSRELWVAGSAVGLTYSSGSFTMNIGVFYSAYSLTTSEFVELLG